MSHFFFVGLVRIRNELCDLKSESDKINASKSEFLVTRLKSCNQKIAAASTVLLKYCGKVNQEITSIAKTNDEDDQKKFTFAEKVLVSSAIRGLLTTKSNSSFLSVENVTRLLVKKTWASSEEDGGKPPGPT